MCIAPVVLDWIKKYEIKSLLNTPCGLCADCPKFAEAGVVKIIGVNIIDPNGLPFHVQGDLCSWRPGEGWDAAYVNCFFCTSNSSLTGDHEKAARNMASWPVKHFILYDTVGFEWRPHFEAAGWRLLESEPEGVSRVEIWERA